MVELECPNLHCGRVFDTPRGWSQHLNWCRCQQRSRLNLKHSKHSKKRKQGNKDEEVVFPPSVSAYRSNLEKQSRQNQNRGTSYNDSRYYNPTNKRNRKNKEKTGQEDVVFDSSHTDDSLLAKEGGEEEEGGGALDEEEGESDGESLRSNDGNSRCTMFDNEYSTDSSSDSEGQNYEVEESEGSIEPENRTLEEWLHIDNSKERDLEQESMWETLLIQPGKEDTIDRKMTNDNSLPPYYAMQIELMIILNQHDKMDKSIHDRLMKCIQRWHDKHPNIMDNWNSHKYQTSDSLLNYLSDKYNQRETIPKQVDLTNSQQKKFSISITDFEAAARTLLNDRGLMDPNNLLDKNFDKANLRPTKDYKDYGPRDMINDVNDGELFHRGYRRVSQSKSPVDGHVVAGLPIIIYMDECHLTRNGSCTSDRVSFTLGILNRRTRARYCSWAEIGMLPNLVKLDNGSNAGKYDQAYYDHKMKAKSGKKPKKDSRTDAEKREDRTLMLEEVFKSFIECCNRGGIRITIYGKKFLFKPFLLGILADAKASHQMCFHYSNFSNMGVKCMCKECKCSPLQMLTPDFRVCKPITLTDIRRAQHDENYAKSISQFASTFSLNSLPLSNEIEGVNGMTPYDPLHAFGLGVYLFQLTFLIKLIGAEGSKKKNGMWMDAIDHLFRAINSDITQNAEKRIPKRGDYGGVTDTTGPMSAEERMGNYLVMLVLLVTQEGKWLFTCAANMKKITIHIPKIISTMELMLSYDQWSRREMAKEELENATAAVIDLMTSMMEYIPSGAESNQAYARTKFHALLLHVRNLIKYGCSSNFDTGPCEQHHITKVKKTGAHTQRRPSSFVIQANLANSRLNLLEHCFDRIRHLCPASKETRHTYTQTSAEDDLVTGSAADTEHDLVKRGRYTLTGAPTKKKERRFNKKKERGNKKGNNANVKWKNKIKWGAKKKQALKVDIHPSIQFAIHSYCETIDYLESYTVEGYTEVTVQSKYGNIIYRASEKGYSDGKPRYDWALVQDDSSCKYIAHIVGFFTWLSPTAGYLEKDKCYVIVEGSTAPWEEKDLKKSIATKFKMTDKDCWILPVNSIIRPLIVIRNFGSTDSVSFINILPKKDWGDIFRRRIIQLMEQEGDETLEEDQSEEEMEGGEEEEEEEHDKKLQARPSLQCLEGKEIMVACTKGSKKGSKKKMCNEWIPFIVSKVVNQEEHKVIVSRKGNTRRNGKNVEMTLHPEKWLKDKNIESAWYNTPKCPSIQSIKGKKVMISWIVKNGGSAWFPGTVSSVVSVRRHKVRIDWGDTFDDAERYDNIILNPDNWWADVLEKDAWWIPQGYPER